MAAALVLLLNLYLESHSSMQALMAAYEGQDHLSRLPRSESALVEHDDPEVEAEKKEPFVDASAYRYHRTVVAKVTGYTPGEESCGKFADGFTSTGANAWALWGVAADPKALPYGTLIYIPGVGYREVDDTGSAMRDAWRKEGKVHIDLRFSQVKDALQWGVRNLQVHIFIPESAL
jgi:3D (Asp-Asp-Asp) domain-containing protein